MSVYSPVVPSTNSRNLIMVFGAASTNRSTTPSIPRVENVNKSCFLGYPTKEVYICTNGAQLDISCSGMFTGSVMNRCPSIAHSTVCNSLSLSAYKQTVTVTDSGCVPIGQH